MPFGVQGIIPLLLPTLTSPTFVVWKPSTSLLGSIVSITLCVSMWSGSGN